MYILPRIPHFLPRLIHRLAVGGVRLASRGDRVGRGAELVVLLVSTALPRCGKRRGRLYLGGTHALAVQDHYRERQARLSGAVQAPRALRRVEISTCGKRENHVCRTFC